MSKRVLVKVVEPKGSYKVKHITKFYKLKELKEHTHDTKEDTNNKPDLPHCPELTELKEHTHDTKKVDKYKSIW